jgi:acyl-CoA synthetase (AMP-forming)/AMP-acid ligase II/aryl carrier-like protein
MGRGEAATVRDVIDRMAALRGEAPFLILPPTGSRVTFAQLQRDSRELAARLAGLGLVKGDRVMLLLENGPHIAELLIGAMYAGLVPVPISTRVGRARVASTLAHSRAGAVFVAPDDEVLLGNELLSGRSVRLVRTDAIRGPDWRDFPVPTADPVELDAEDDALLAYTSGTTGEPKGVLLTHRAVVAAAANVVGMYGLSAADRALCVLPLSQRSAQNTTLLATLLSGGSVVLPRGFEVTGFWELVRRHRCTWLGLVPAMISQLLSHAERSVAPETLSHVRFARSSSAPLASAVHREFEARFNLPLVEAMGQTEAGSAIFSNQPPPARSKTGSVGTVFGFDVKVVDDAGRALPPGRTGEILVRGESVMKGYYNDAVATAEVLTPDGWLRTGDVGYRDEEGYVFLAGRVGEIINRGGVKIAPREIDEVLLRHPAVLDAAAAGVSDAYLGHDVMAWVVLRPGATCSSSELLALCERELGQYRCPTSIHFIEALPRGPSGKVQRSRLVEEQGRQRPRLEAPHARPPQTVLGHVPPRTPIERILCEAWGAVLDREPIGVHDEFLELGGDSLRAIRILARLAGSLPVRLSFGAFLAHPTVAEQAQLVDDALLHELGDKAALFLLQEMERLREEEVAGRGTAERMTMADDGRPPATAS